ncbi:unnamed protein product [Phytomonas sp. Hart1]|nr:unnamed protein product [Phytomonas sp. Hart1]|eukprot:CCW67507.1 unnamed protein product [Phytomonas sp. isolate Hart1]
MAGWARQLWFAHAPGPVDEAFFTVLQRLLVGRTPEGPGAKKAAEGLKAATVKELCAAMTPLGVLHVLVEATLAMLIAKGFVVKDEPTEGPVAAPPSSSLRRVRLRVTPFGASSVRSCFNVEEALFVREELDRLRRTGVILADDLHLCYFMAPPREAKECDWGLYREHLARLDDDRQRIADLIGVDEYLVNQLAMGITPPSTAASFSFFAASLFETAASCAGEVCRQNWFIARRFYLAMMLADILSEVPLAEVEWRYRVQRGQLQALMRSVSMYSSSITNFCRAMEWFSLEAVLTSFIKRLGFGVKPDLLPLMEIKGIQPPRARALWNAGLRTPSQIAAMASPEALVERVKVMNPPDNKAALYFTKRSALMVIHAASLKLQEQIQQKMDELKELKGKRS